MIECDDLRAGTIARETDRLRAGAAADLEHARAARKPDIPMEQANNRRSLRHEALALALAVSMDVHKGKAPPRWRRRLERYCSRVTRRHAPGLKPNCRANTRVMWLWSENP